jgi:hypothetical protein
MPDPWTPTSRRVLASLALALGVAAAGCAGGAGTGGPCPRCDDAAAPDSGPRADAAPVCRPTCADAGTTPPPAGALPRLVAYVNCLCGFGTGDRGGECLAEPDPGVNQVKAWEDAGQSPITHYVISFLSFASTGDGIRIRTDPGEIWNDPGGSTTDFALEPHLRAALASAQAHGKKIMLSIGGEVGSSGFLGWRNAVGVAGMRAELERVAAAFEAANGLTVDGFDVDIELGGYYAYGSDKYQATRDLIDAVPDRFLVAFVPQVGNGLCAAPNVGDALDPLATLGGQCQQPDGQGAPWVLARLDQDCTRGDGSPKLDYFGVQYYNAGQASCCGGGASAADQAISTAQSYANLANGWPAFGSVDDPSNPWYGYRYYPGPWAAFAGIGADRLVLGKPGCQGCAGSDYLDLAGMDDVLGQLDGRLDQPMGGVLFWDLCRLFGGTGPQCVSGTCQPSWGGADVLANLTDLRARMAALQPRAL